MVAVTVFVVLASLSLAVFAHYHARQERANINLLTGQRVYLTARVAEAGTVYRIGPDSFRRLMSEDPELSDLLLKAFLARAVALGAKEARLVPTRNVFTAEWVRLKCQYGCGAYASSRNCPPYSPTPERTRALVQRARSVDRVLTETEIRAVLDSLDETREP